MRETSLLRGLAPALLVHRWALPAVVVLGVLSSLAEGIGIGLFVPLLNALLAPGESGSSAHWLIDLMQRPFDGVDPGRRVPLMAVCIFVAILMRSLLSYGHRVLFDWLDADVGHRLRTRVFRQLLAMGFGGLERDRSGHLLNVLASDTWRASEALKISVYLVITGATVLVYGLLMVLMSWRLTMIVVAATTLISFVMRGIARRTARLGEVITTENAELGHRMNEGIDGMRIIRAFGREDYEFRRFEVASRRVREALAKSGYLEGSVSPIFEIFAATLILLVLVFTIGSAADMSVVLVFLFVLYRLQPRLRDIDGARVRLATLGASVKEVSTLLDPTDKEYVRSGSVSDFALADRIRFESVSFRYAVSDEYALHDLSFSIPVGATVAFAGPSGGGKSTVIKLLLRFHDPTAGRILVDDVPLPDLDLGAWRGRIALVSQDVYIFNASVRDNIAYGRVDATDVEIVEAARLAEAHDFVSRLPDGYDTVLGHHGTRLSGGQQQRISLARAIVRDPDILILDEATNALDSISEQLIQETLDELRRGRTVIMIAHRLSTIERADHVIVLEEGRIHEQGTLAELKGAGGLLDRMYRIQHRASSSRDV